MPELTDCPWCGREFSPAEGYWSERYGGMVCPLCEADDEGVIFDDDQEDRDNAAQDADF